MRVDGFLSRLERVKATGHNRWMARCPAHDDRIASLTITEGDDGRVLAHCFAGCTIQSVVESVGMDLSDIMPEGPAPDVPAKRMKFNPADVLEAMAFSAMTVAILAADMAKGRTLSDEEKDTLFSIAGEFQEAIELCGATKRRDAALDQVRNDPRTR